MKELEVYRDHGPVDERRIDDFERVMGVRFPRTYRSLLSRHDALRPENADFDFIDRSSGKLVGRDVAFFGFGESLPRCHRIADAQDHDVYGHEGIVQIGVSANGDFVGFDYRGDPASDEPKVVALFHDVAGHDGKMLVSLVADSFEEFIGLLHKSDE